MRSRARLPVFVLLCTSSALKAADASQTLACEEVHARDEQGRVMKDLKPNDFAVLENGVERPIDRWSRSVGWFGGVKYEICFSPVQGERPGNKSIEIKVKRAGARVTWKMK